MQVCSNSLVQFVLLILNICLLELWMVAKILADEQRKFILKQYAKTEVNGYGRHGLAAFNSFSPICLNNYCIREKFDAIRWNNSRFCTRKKKKKSELQHVYVCVNLSEMYYSRAGLSMEAIFYYFLCYQFYVKVIYLVEWQKSTNNDFCFEIMVRKIIKKWHSVQWKTEKLYTLILCEPTK